MHQQPPTVAVARPAPGAAVAAAATAAAMEATLLHTATDYGYTQRQQEAPPPPPPSYYTELPGKKASAFISLNIQVRFFTLESCKIYL